MADVLIVGGGQAGLAASVCLGRLGIANTVLEKGSIGESWRTQRWDSFCMNTPNWTLNLPGSDYAGSDPDGFMDRADFVVLLEDYAARNDIPVRTGVEAIRAAPSASGWQLETSSGQMEARALIIATSSCQTPSVPSFAHKLPDGIASLSAADFRSAAALPPGRVLVVGSAQSGVQIAEDLVDAGREVMLSVGNVGRIPRRYRGRDVIYWYDRIGLMDRSTSDLDDPRRRFGGQPQYTGWRGGHTVSLQKLRHDGVRLLGRTRDIDEGRVWLDNDLRANIAAADRYAADFCKSVDAFIDANGLNVPPDTGDDPVHAPVTDLESIPQPASLDLEAENVTSVIW